MNQAGSLRISAVVALCALAWGGQSATPQSAGKRAAARPGPQESVDRMLARVFRAPEVRSRVTILRSDPFGGPGERSEGRVWFLPGRGLRYRSDEKDGEDIVVDREQRTFLVYRPSEQVVYRADWDRAPARMRQLIEEPERILEAKFRAARERRHVGGVWREGYRMQRATLGDSLPSVAVWIAADPVTGDLHLSLPHDVRTEPLDPRDLLPGGESR